MDLLQYAACILGISLGYFFNKKGCKYWIAILGFTIGTLLFHGIKYLISH